MILDIIKLFPRSHRFVYNYFSMRIGDFLSTWQRSLKYLCTVEPLLWGHPEERPTPLERPLDTVNININVLISTPDERPPLLKGHISAAKGVASQEGFHCTEIIWSTSKIHWAICFNHFTNKGIFFFKHKKICWNVQSIKCNPMKTS